MKAMILGANGLCGLSLTPLMRKLHPEIELFLIDPDEEAKADIIHAAPEAKDLWHILKSFGLGRGDILIDLAPDLIKLDVMQAADNVGVSVINATCCEHQRGTLGVIDLIDPKLLLARYDWKAPHLVDSGMNPGNVNAMLAALAEKHGKPVNVTQYEMDSTEPYKWDGEGFATWSPEELASEFADESTWEVDGRKIIFAEGPPIDNKRQMPDGNTGALCQHEEILNWGWRYGCKARYLYGFEKKAMAAIEKNIRAGLELSLVRKLDDRPPTGSDKISLAVEFEDGSTANASMEADNEWDEVPPGSNATSYLVAVGVVTGVQMLKQAKKGINWPDDCGPAWIDFIAKNKLCDLDLD